MGRIRTVKPELFLDEDLGALSGDHLALFVGLWTVADREGRLAWRPARLKATLFPYREVDLEALAQELAAIGKIVLYDIEGESYAWVPGFVKHQRPHPKEPPSTIPPPGAATSLPPPPPRLVYFIQGAAGGPIKIGSAANVTHRLAGLQTGHHEELRVLGTTSATDHPERDVHAQFAAARGRGEWFAPTPELLAFISRVCSEPQPLISRTSIRVLPVESRGKGREGKGREGNEPAADFALEEQRAGPAPRKPSRQERLAHMLADQRTHALGAAAVPDDVLDAETLNRILEPALAASDEILFAGHALYLEDDFALSRDPPCPLRLFAKQWNRWVSAANRSNQVGAQ